MQHLSYSSNLRSIAFQLIIKLNPKHLSMLAFTHLPTGLFAGVSTSIALQLPSEASRMLIAASMVGSLLPDIDHPKSWIGRRILFISLPISALVGHRGITHSLLAILGMAIVGYMGLTYWRLDLGAWAPSVVGLSLGYASHLFGDWASNSGIPLLWPSSKRYRSPVVFCTGGIEERIMAIAMWIGSAYMYLHLV